jgi:hypothetical protein
MFMVPASVWIPLSRVVWALLTVMRHHSVVIQAITAMRMYRGLVDSTVVNSPVVVGTNLKGLSTKSELKFAVRQVPSHSDSEDGTLGTGNPAHEANYLAPSPQRFMFMTGQDNDRSEAFGSKTV